MPIINVKLNHFGTFRRFAVEAADDELALASLKQKVHALDAECRLAWIDEDGDQIVFDTVDEFRLALSARKDETLRLIAVKKPVTTPKYVHRNITCDGCEREVVGRRFKCLVCPDFDLCETCEQASLQPNPHEFQAGKHGEHAMSRIVDDKTQLVPWIRPFGYGHGFGHCRRQAPFAPAAPPTSNASTPGGSTPAPPTGGKGPLHDELLFKHYEARQAKLLKKELKESRRERKRVEREMREREMARLREGLRASMTTGVDFLREVGAQVQQALSTFGIDVDVSVDNNGKTEKVETGTEAKEEAPKAAAPAAPAPTAEETKPEEEKLEEAIPLIDIKKDEEKEQPKAPLVPSAPLQPEVCEIVKSHPRQVAVTTSSSEDDDDWLAVHKPAYPSLHPVFTQPLPTPSVQVRHQLETYPSQAPASPHPHQAVIDTITSMGFNDRNEVTRVVEMTNGNVEEAVNMLISKDSWF